ncbi:MAG: glycosyltransferase [Parachlamydiaceae bacterium]|nr:glycosyltransferase [Parachlamydiaceae bacterium]
MKIKKIYLFAPITNQYGVIDYFTEEFANALLRQGVETKIIKADRYNPREFLNQILTDPPDCTLSFNGLLPDEEGRFLSEVINIPHVAYLTDSPTHYFPLVRSRNTTICCIDQDFCHTFQNMNFSRVLFLPHAASKNLTPPLEPDYIYDVLMLNSFIDYEEARKKWQEKFGLVIGAVLDEAAEWALSDRDIPYMQALVDTLDKHLKMGKSIDPRNIDFQELLDSLETFIVGKSRIELLKSIEGASVHIFGSKPGSKEWKKYLSQYENIHIHETIPFTQILELMKRAKIVLNSTPQIKRGLHERILSSLACGAAVLALDTPYLSEIFKDEEDILLYKPRDWKEVNRKIQVYLSDESKRQKLVEKGREKVMRFHTWDQRAKTLLTALPEFLSHSSL